MTIRERFELLRQQAQQRRQQQQRRCRTFIQLGAATCENAAGARLVHNQFQRLITTSGRDDIHLRQVGCTGRCSREPIVNILRAGELPVKYEHVTPDLASRIFHEHVIGGKPIHAHILDGDQTTIPHYDLLFCSGARCGSRQRHDQLHQSLITKLQDAGLGPDQVQTRSSACFGLCQHEQQAQATHILVRPTNVIYRVTSDDDLDAIIRQHLQKGQIVESLRVADRALNQQFFAIYGDVAFFNSQSRLALRNSGIVDPESIDEYLQFNGFAALATALAQPERQWIFDQIQRAKLRGRGGAGYATAQKWHNAANTAADQRYVVCNADEGDPGAFMDRSMLEGDPFSVIEGMLIGALAVGASQGFFYIRAEYPLAIRRVEQALAQAQNCGLLGNDILGSGFNCELQIRLGAGAFVCGEETALIHSIEGARGQPRIRPPYPAIHGLWGKPTVINNVETWANVPVIINYGPEWFHQFGTANSGGTKVFALAGKVEHTGLVEVPMGTTLREIVEVIGGGVASGKKLKAIQTGGPAGGCIPASAIDLPVDFESLTAAGSIMGSGGMIVMDEDDCMVDVAKYYLGFSQLESCGKCTPCREGTMRMLEILQRISAGNGVDADMLKLERLGRLLQRSSLCGLGRAAPNPLLSTLQHFSDEFRIHIQEKRCPVGKCSMKGSIAA